MSASQSKDHPPAYDDEAQPSDAATHTVLESITAAINAECDNPNDDPVETARMRNFLLFCLAVDYRVPCAVQISAPNRDHFLRISGNIFTMHCVWPKHRLSAEDRTLLAPYFWKYLHSPCITLGIPVEAAVVAAHRFSKYLAQWGRYKGCIHGVLHNQGFKNLGRKLILDKNILIPRLLPNCHDSLRIKLEKSLTEISNSYFAYIGDSLTIDPNSGPANGVGAGFKNGQRAVYVLTERGRRYAANRDATLNVVKEQPGPVCDGIFRRLRDVAKRIKAAGLPKNAELLRKSDPPRQALSVRALALGSQGCGNHCSGHMLGTDGASKAKSMWDEPPRTRDHASSVLPDMFEHRRGKAKCDA